MRISEGRIAHMHGVAEWMYEHAEEFGCPDRERMYLLGLLHDIGYLYQDVAHEERGAELVGQDSAVGQLIAAHGMMPDEYMARHLCSEEDIPKELILLWAADMSVDITGRAVGFTARLQDIRERHGEESKAYQSCLRKVRWLEGRK